MAAKWAQQLAVWRAELTVGKKAVNLADTRAGKSAANLVVKLALPWAEQSAGTTAE